MKLLSSKILLCNLVIKYKTQTKIWELHMYYVLDWITIDS